MPRSILALMMVAMLGIGMLVGSLLTPAARAQKPTVTEPVQNNTPGATYAQNYPGYPGTPGYYPAPVRWQVIVIPGTDRRDEAVTMLLDTLTGDSFYLTKTNNRLYWTRITR